MHSLNGLVESTAESVQFLLATEEKTQLILIKQAYLLDRLARAIYGLDDSEAPAREEIEQALNEVRALFEEQRRLFEIGPP